jgi:hypothetical protein
MERAKNSDKESLKEEAQHYLKIEKKCPRKRLFSSKENHVEVAWRFGFLKRPV